VFDLVEEVVHCGLDWVVEQIRKERYDLKEADGRLGQEAFMGR
jgi:hypothetical protein